MRTAFILLASVLASSAAFAEDKDTGLFSKLYKSIDLAKQQIGMTDYEGLIEFSKKHTKLEVVQDGIVVDDHCRYKTISINYTLSPEKPYKLTFSAPKNAAFDRMATIQIYERGSSCSERILLFEDTIQIMSALPTKSRTGPHYILRNLAGQKL